MSNLKQFFFLNIILAISAYILIFKVGAISNFENMLFLIISSGFITSFFIKENILIRYLKIAVFNSLFFGFLLGLIFMIDIFTDDISTGIFEESFYMQCFYSLIVIILLVGLCNLFGGLVGVVLKGLVERLKIAKN